MKKTFGWIILGGVGVALAYILLKLPKGEAGDVQTFLRRISPYQPMITEYADEFNLDADLIRAVIWVESSGFPNASRKEDSFYSYGLLGVTLAAARDVGFTGEEADLFNPEVNIHYGSAYLSSWMDKAEGNVELAISSYNGGYKAFNYYKENGRLWNPTYVNRVLDYYQKISKIEEV